MEVSCFIPGNENTFTVDVEMTGKVHSLKKRIKHEKPITFTDVEADHLVLYQVTIEEDLDKEQCIEKLEKLSQNKECRWLDERIQSSIYFGESPPSGMEYYIIVEKRKGESIC